MFLLGTDQLGRDLFSRLIVATRISLSIGLVGVALSLFLGILLGGVSGLYGGMVDTLIQRLIEIMRSMPTIPLWMGLAAALPNTWSVTQIYFAITLIISLVGWTELARVVRGRFLALREEDFVIAAELAGASQMRIIFRHMLPSFVSHIIAAVSLALPAMIVSETSLSFLGLGLRPPAISWGILLQDAQNIQVLARRAVAARRGGPGDPGHPGLQLPRRRPARCGGSLWLTPQARSAVRLSVRDLDSISSQDGHRARGRRRQPRPACRPHARRRRRKRLRQEPHRARHPRIVDRPGRIGRARCCSTRRTRSSRT